MSASQFPEGKQIAWPEHYRPANCAVHVRNELFIPVQPELVWAWLVRAPLWPSWYPNASDVRAADDTLMGDLLPGSVFRWTTFSVPIESTVREFVPHERLAWDAQGIGLDAYHAWLLHPDDGGCWVLTEESQHGWGASIVDALLPERMWEGHDLWLRSLAIQCGKGWPPAI